MANSADPDQLASSAFDFKSNFCKQWGAVWSGSTLFACMQKKVRKVCKNIQQTPKTDDIFRRRFSWHFMGKGGGFITWFFSEVLNGFSLFWYLPLTFKVTFLMKCIIFQSHQGSRILHKGLYKM